MCIVFLQLCLCADRSGATYFSLYMDTNREEQELIERTYQNMVYSTIILRKQSS